MELRNKETEEGSKLALNEKDLANSKKEFSIAQSKLENQKDQLIKEEKSRQHLKKSIEADKKTKTLKEQEFLKLKETSSDLLQQDEEDTKVIENAKKRLQALAKGEDIDEYGKAASIESQINRM